MKKIRVLVVDDHAVVRKGIRLITNTEPSIEIVGEAIDGDDAIYQAKELQPDVILMDLVMPQKSGAEAIARVKQNQSEIKIIVLTTFEDMDKINAAMEAGADGYILKDADGEFLLQAIQSAQKGEMPLHPRIARYLIKGETTQDARSRSNILADLTDREIEVLKLITRGCSNKEIAQSLHLANGTVKVHVSSILNKLNVTSRTEAAVLAAQLGLMSTGDRTD